MRLQFEYPRAYHDAWSLLSKGSYGMASHGKELWIEVYSPLDYADEQAIIELKRQERAQRKSEGR